MNKNFLLFDFDGVIADSFEPAFEVNKIICPHITEDEYRRRFEGNIYERKLADETHTDMCRHDVDFFAEYLPRMEKSVRPFQGMESVVAGLAKEYTLIIISSETTATILGFLKKYNLDSYFTEILGCDVHKSKVEKMNMVLSKYSITPERCLFVTDTLGDIREADRKNIGAVAVSWGFHTHETLSQGKPFRIVDRPTELATAVSDYFAR